MQGVRSALVPVPLSILGLSLVIVETLLLYAFRDPWTGHGLVLESHNARREKVGARFALALVLLGSVLQVVAVAVA